jgi:hypothetical protein
MSQGQLTVSFCKIFKIVRSLRNLYMYVTRSAYSLILQNFQNCQVPEELVCHKASIQSHTEKFSRLSGP